MRLCTPLPNHTLLHKGHALLALCDASQDMHNLVFARMGFWPRGNADTEAADAPANGIPKSIWNLRRPKKNQFKIAPHFPK